MEKRTKIELRREAAYVALHKAAAEFIKAHGGTCAASGPVTIIRWPTDRRLNYTLGLRITGRPPTILTEIDA